MVDTAAAGDAFSGALASAVSSGGSTRRGGALAVTEAGAIPSLSTLSEVQEFMAGRAD